MKKCICISVALVLLLQNNAQSEDNSSNPLFRIRTITAGVNLKNVSDLATIDAAIRFLGRAKMEFEKSGYEVQTLRIATQPLSTYLGDLSLNNAISSLMILDSVMASNNIMFSLGPVITDDRYDPEFASWAANLIRSTQNTSISVFVASERHGIHSQTALTAAEAMIAISRATDGGEGNFRFTASVNCPPNIPFFPAAFHNGVENFAIGLESPGLLKEAFQGAKSVEDAKERLKSLMESRLKPIEKIAVQFSDSENREYSGIDVSPAPGLDSSIGEAIEVLSGAPFGEPSTLRVCAAITDVLKGLEIKKCGYSGLMLPVIEDKVLAQRATEGRYTVQELLLYSSVCGTGLDVVPLPGETSRQRLTKLIEDVAALSTKLARKPLSARLFLIPGKKAGDFVTFENVFLTDCTVMRIE